MAVGEKRDLYNGFGETFSRAVEFAVTPFVFAGLGYLLDRWIGTGKVFLISFTILALVGSFLRIWYGYQAAMKLEEAKGPWNNP